MNAELDRRWREAVQPFDGLIVCSRPLPLAELARSLVPVVATLRQTYEGRLINTFLDWHQHDGYTVVETKTSWDELTNAVASETRLMDWSSDDTLVRRAWYCDDYQFLLRWCVSSDGADFSDGVTPPLAGSCGCFDLTGNVWLVNHVAHDLIDPPAESQPAAAYFAKTYAG